MDSADTFHCKKQLSFLKHLFFQPFREGFGACPRASQNLWERPSLCPNTSKVLGQDGLILPAGPPSLCGRAVPWPEPHTWLAGTSRASRAPTTSPFVKPLQAAGCRRQPQRGGTHRPHELRVLGCADTIAGHVRKALILLPRTRLGAVR